MIEPGSTSESGFTYVGETVLHEGFVISVAQGEFETPEGDRILVTSSTIPAPSPSWRSTATR